VLGRHIRVEHWANALHQTQAAARAMLGQDAVVFRGDVQGREFIAFWLNGGRVLAGMNVNVWDVNEVIQEMVRGGREVDAARLADADVPLQEFLG
jgi:3-phenylpropionate/trans-cinnamate dioxygenase ferredoxin reductase subunit